HLREMIRIAAMAPSVNNFQPWKFMVITSRDLLSKMANIVSEKIQSLPTNESLAAENIKSQVEFFATFFRDAPALIVLLMEEYESVLEKGVRMTHEEINKERNFPDLQSAGACIENLLLAAVDMGYGACWLSAPLMAANELAQLLEVEKPYRIIAFTAVGKPAHNPLPKSRKELDELIIWKE
ncbi:MAG TPA: nitroreductase family protein, partial [Bacteroidales bacterium]|nr:nitroreductase family protein [Bacteroidales bacterium]